MVRKKKIVRKSEDPADQNPTGNERKSSARTRRKKDRRLFGGTTWERKDDNK